MQFNVPNAPKQYTSVLGDFLGVDFTSISPSKRRASNMINLVNNNGFLETRPGYAAIGHEFTDENINGIWNIDQDGTNVFVAHVGTKLYLLDEDFDNPTELAGVSTLNDNVSTGVYLNNKLIIFDGKRAIAYHKASTWKAVYLDTIGTVPIISISRSPDGTGGESYDEVNLIQPYRKSSFIADGASATYKLETAYDNEAPTATVLDENGTPTNLTVLSFDKDAGTVTFTTVPPVSPVDGRDNVIITYKVTNTETTSWINKATLAIEYGYNGDNNRLFVSGNPDFPNIDWYTYIDDPTYFPASNYRRVGFEPIENYLRLNDGTLAIQKKISDTDATIYYTKSAMYNGQEVFPIETGVKSLGCIAKRANANLVNDPLTLTDVGVYAIVGSNYGERFADERGYFIKNKLLEEPNLENAVAIVYKGKYYLAINNHVYVADSRYKTKVAEASNSGFQYEWYYWENVPVRSWFTYNDELYFTTNTGVIAKFDNDIVTDFELPITQSFDTTFLDLGSITNAKTIKRVTVISRPYTETQFTLSYITDEEVTAITSRTYEEGDFPNTLQEKEKIKKFMFVKFRISSDVAKKLNFYQMAVEFVYAGHFRG